MVLRLAEAKRVIDAAIAKAQDLNVEVSVAVCDQNCRLIALNIMDGAAAMANQGAIGKAVAAAAWGLPSGDPRGRLDNLRASLAVGVGTPAIAVAGGLPIIRDGAVEGACGAAGADTNGHDEECARAGIAALRDG